MAASGGQWTGRPNDFVHLHVHTEYSMLDGAAKNQLLFAEAARQEMPAIAMTDHGNMFGAHEFFTSSRQYPVRPIIGIEAYVAPSTRFSRTPEFWATGKREAADLDTEAGKDVSGGGRYTHMTMLARDATGLRNLFRLSSLASFEGYYMKPRMDRALIAEHADGIIATTGCPGGEVQTRLRLGQFDEAVKAAAAYRDIFGAENYFLEIMDHGVDVEQAVRSDLLRLAKHLNLPLLATNDSHYVTEDDAEAHDNLLCIGVGRNKDDDKRFRFKGSGYYLKSGPEMRMLFRDLPEACDNTLLVAERIEDYGEVFAHVDRMPQFDVPPGETQGSQLRAEIEKGIRLRYPDGVEPEGLRERVELEMSVIEPLGYSSYFLIVADICRYARDSGVPVGPGRGSAAGSMVSYLTQIIEVDPMKHGLLFERFLNPERVSPPDIDLDFDDRRRDVVIDYVTTKYGKEYTSQVNTFGTIKAKAAVKDSSRILGYPFSLGERITKAMPPAVMGKDVPLSDLFNPQHKRYAEGAEFRALYESDPDVKKVVDTGRGIEGMIRGTGVHACAFIISSEPLIDVIPMHRRDKDGMIIAGFAYPQCEEMGLMKMDFLGLRNLGVIDAAIRNVRANRGIDIDLREIPFDDPATYQLLSRGDTLGVFQLDGGPMRALLRQMKPTVFDDVTAVIALYRPGPMGANAHINYAERKNGRQTIVPIHPELKDALDPILGDTYHLIVYQEQIMAAARSLAGYSLGGADLLRRAMGKKKKEILDKEWDNFSSGMTGNGFSAQATRALWDVMVPFADYAFNKSHAAGYAYVSYWTAYLKANYPAEFGAALLTSVGDDKDKMAMYLADMRSLRINVLPPDVNTSVAEFSAVGDDIRFGLAAIRNVGTAVVEGILSARDEHGPASDFYQFLDRVPLSVCNKRMVESLIKAGAFDSMHHTRRALMEVYESAIDQVLDLKRNEAIGQDDLFGDFGDFGGALDDKPAPRRSGTVSDIPEWDKRTRLAFEREMLGLYVSDHPLNGVEHILGANRDVSLASLVNDPPKDAAVTVAGMITSVVRKQTRAGDTWAIVTVEDLDAAVEVLVFPRVYQTVAMTLATDTVVRIKGRAAGKDESVEIRAQEVHLLNVQATASGPLTISVPTVRVTPVLVDRLKEVLRSHPGSNEARLRLVNGVQTKTFRLDGGLRVATSGALIADLKALLGPSCVE